MINVWCKECGALIVVLDRPAFGSGIPIKCPKCGIRLDSDYYNKKKEWTLR